MIPELLFKFRKITTVEELIRVIDSINNHHIYFPNYKQLNDPLESSGYIVEVSGYSGFGIRQAADEEENVVHNIRMTYKILSLSEDCFSPIMWAHYAQDYNGICIGYWRKDVFISARKIMYLSKPHSAYSTNEDGFIPDDPKDQVDKEIFESFFYKHCDWSSEKEWRIVQKTSDDYLKYDNSCLACIIFGDRLDKEIRDILIKQCSLKVPMFYTKTGYRTFGINFLPIDYEIEFDGKEPPYIKTVEDFINQLQMYKCNQ